MPFAPGDQVHVAVFGKGVVRGVRNAGRYVVEVKGRAMVVAERELTPVEASKGRRAPPQAASNIPADLARTHAPASIDLHGKVVNDAIAALDAFLNDAILAGLAEVRVIHGRSGGRLKAAVHRRLTLLAPVRSYRVDSTNPGVTIVTL